MYEWEAPPLRLTFVLCITDSGTIGAICSSLSVVDMVARM